MQKKRFQDLVENTPDLIQVVDKKGKFLYVNKSWIKTLGYTKKQALNMSFHDIIKKDLLSHLLMIFAQLKKGKSFERIETVFLTKKGKEIFVEGTPFPKIVKGKFIEIRGIFRDITKQKKAEEKYKSLYESSQDAIMILEPPTWAFTAGNPTAIQLFECKNEKEFISFTPGDLSPKKQPDEQPSSDKAKKMIMKAMKEGSNFFEWTHKTAKGKEFPCTVLLTRFNKEGKPVLQATVRDITKEKQAEEKFKAISESAQEGIILMNEKGKVIFWNKAAEKIFQWKKKEIMGKNLHEIIAPKKFMPAHKKAFPNFVKTGKGNAIGKTLELEAIRKNKEVFPVELSLSSVKINNKWNAIGIIRDITGKKEFEKKIILEKEKAAKYLNLAGTIILALNKKGEIELINQKGLDILGYKKEELIGKNWFNTCIPKKIKNEVKEVFAKLILGEVPSVKNYENEIITKNKKTKIISWYNVVNKNQKGKIIGTISSGEDITQRKIDNEEIKKFNEFAVNREIKMIELKKEINSLLKKLNKPQKYNVSKK